MAHAHDHSAGNKKRILIALSLTATFMVVEVVGGIISGSLALLADAGHMLTDTMALGLAAIAFHMSGRPADRRRSYGYARFQILAAFVNGLSLLIIVGWIIYEAVQRFITPVEIVGETMLVIAFTGLLVNAASFFTLHGGDQENLNMRGAVLHVVGDLLGSVAAIIAAIVILTTGWIPIDPILSVAVAMLILRSAWHLVRRSTHILLEGAPDGFIVDEMHDYLIETIPEICDVHHVHVWGLTAEDRMLTMHIALAGEGENATDVIRQVKGILAERYQITHTTIEAETDSCADE